MPVLRSRLMSCVSTPNLPSATTSPPKAKTMVLPRKALKYGAAERNQATNWLWTLVGIRGNRNRKRHSKSVASGFQNLFHSSGTAYFLLPRPEVAALLFELRLVDLASGVTLAKYIQRCFLAQPGFAAPGPCAESTHQHDDSGNDQSPEQQHADTHSATPESISVVSPHHVYLQ